MGLNRRTNKDAEQAKEAIEKGEKEEPIAEPDFSNMLSTGCTLLDLCITGGVTEEGGVPAGTFMEIFGESGSGKTAIISEMATSAQKREWEVEMKDPEGRMNKEYSKIYGVNWSGINYDRPNTVEEVFESIRGAVRQKLFGVDSLAALSTKMELEEDEGDKMGMRRAKVFSQGLRVVCRDIANKGLIVACTNQIRHGKYGVTTPGGEAIAFYSSVRLQGRKDDEIWKEKTIKGKKFKNSIGIESTFAVRKNSLGVPRRSCKVYIVYNYGIDDIRGNLQFCKEAMGLKTYDACGKSYQSMDDAIEYIEKNRIANKLRKETIKLWKEIEKAFAPRREEKMRF